MTIPKKRAVGRGAKSDSTPLWAWGSVAAAGVALGGMALFNDSRRRRAENENLPAGRFIEVDGIAVHYVEAGQGQPIVLLHGNGSMVEDWIVSGLFDVLARTHRVIAFDRPGFGHTPRPRTRIWTPSAQGRLLFAAMEGLGIERPILVGHSFGALVALTMALDNPQALARTALLGGYYYPSLRADVPILGLPAIPLLGDIMRYTISPLLASVLLPAAYAKIFAPAPVPERWTSEFPGEMLLRPSQIRAAAADADLMIPAAAAIGDRIAALALPVTIVAGADDSIVDVASQSRRLHEELPTSRLIEIAGSGHMVHHSAMQQVAEAILSEGTGAHPVVT